MKVIEIDSKSGFFQDLVGQHEGDEPRRSKLHSWLRSILAQLTTKMRENVVASRARKLLLVTGIEP